MPVPLALVAGEASGDLLASLVLRALQRRIPDLDPYGIGGARLEAEGLRVVAPMELLSVRGYAEVLRNFPALYALRGRLVRTLRAERPAAFMGIDAPDFNLGLEARLRRAGIRTIHFVSPSIWAWRGSRINKIRRAVDHMLVLFPFEEPIYRDAGIPATFVGHPLAEIIPRHPDKQAARAALGLAEAGPVLAVLPGSRVAEIHYLARTFLETAALLVRCDAALRVLVPIATAATAQQFDAIRREPAFAALPLTVVPGGSHQVLAACDAALVASGTATLETALYGRPMVIAYRMAESTWQIMRRMGYLPWVGLPNIMARETLVPEFLQHAVTPSALAEAMSVQLYDAANRARLEERFAAMHDALRRDTADLAADVVASILKGAARG